MSTSPRISPRADILLHTASGLSGVHAHGAMTPEAVLLALLHDTGICGEADCAVPEERELRRVLLTSQETGNPHGWTERAHAVYQRAWQRAQGRGRERSLEGGRFALGSGPFGVGLRPAAALTLGDILSGLAGSGATVDAILRRRGLDPAQYDDEADPPRGELVPAGAGPTDGVVRLVAMNDDRTPMDFVVWVLEDQLGRTQMRALWLMYAIHLRGRETVWRGPRGDAEAHVARVHEAARAAGFPFEVRCVLPG